MFSENVVQEYMRGRYFRITGIVELDFLTTVERYLSHLSLNSCKEVRLCVYLDCVVSELCQFFVRDLMAFVRRDVVFKCVI